MEEDGEDTNEEKRLGHSDGLGAFFFGTGRVAFGAFFFLNR